MERLNGKRGILLAATSDPELATKLDGLEAGGIAGKRIVSGGKDLLNGLMPANMLPHESEMGNVRIVLVDDELADGRGRDLVEELHRVRGDLKIIFVAKMPDEQLEVSVRQAGVYFFMVKPIDAELLGRLVEKAIEHESTSRRVGTSAAKKAAV